MRRLITIAALLAALAVPAAAQPQSTYTKDEMAAADAAVKAAALSPDLDKLMWCTAAFGLMKEVYKTNGQGDAASEVEQLHRTITTRAAEAALKAGLAQDKFAELSKTYTIHVTSQMSANGGADYGQDVCTTAAQ